MDPHHAGARRARRGGAGACPGAGVAGRRGRRQPARWLGPGVPGAHRRQRRSPGSRPRRRVCSPWICKEIMETELSVAPAAGPGRRVLMLIVSVLAAVLLAAAARQSRLMAEFLVGISVALGLVTLLLFVIRAPVPPRLALF